jgi:hypothetical protein
MIISPGTLVAVVDGEKLALFENTGHQEITLTPRAVPRVAERASGGTGHTSSSANPDNDTQAEDGFAIGVTEVLTRMVLDHMVEARKLSVCETAPLSPECQDVLEENRRVSQIGMLALRKTLEDKTIVEPVSVDLVWTRGPPTYVDFEETVYNAQVQEDEDQGARDLSEVK